MKTLLMAIAFFALSLTGAQAATIGTVNTGEADYTISGPGIVGTVPTVLTGTHPAWATPNGSAAWIGISDFNTTDSDGVYVFTTTFNLAASNFSTASILGKIAADNSASVSLNGVDTGVSVGGFGSLSDFSILSGFVSGLNTLEFFVTNGVQARGNPMGLLVSDSTLSVVPLPGALPLFGAALIGVGFIARRKKQAKAKAV